MLSCEPFKIKIARESIEQLKTSLINSQPLVPTYESTTNHQNFGIKLDSLVQLKRVWESEFLDKWNTIEHDLNELPHFKSNIKYQDRSINLHFIHYPSPNKDAIPLLLLHGWPGSFCEHIRLIRLLKEGESQGKQSYHLVVPSMPGYLFSDAPPLDRDFGIVDVAEIMNNLMIGLGYKEGYAVQGGDWGSFVARSMATLYPAEVKCVHFNFIPVPTPSPRTLLDKIGLPSLSKYIIPSILASSIQTILRPLLPTSSNTDGLDKMDLAAAKKSATFFKSGRGYSLEHATRPSTIGFCVDSSPIALLAWVGEKFIEWSDKTPSDDEILTTLTLWHVTHTFSTSIYQYRHDSSTPSSAPSAYVHQPVGFSSFAYEIIPTPKKWAERTVNLVWYRRHSTGGHFAALEKPEVMAQDLNDFFGSVWKGLKRSSKL